MNVGGEGGEIRHLLANRGNQRETGTGKRKRSSLFRGRKKEYGKCGPTSSLPDNGHAGRGSPEGEKRSSFQLIKRKEKIGGKNQKGSAGVVQKRKEKNPLFSKGVGEGADS